MEVIKKYLLPGFLIMLVGAAVGFFAKPAKVTVEYKDRVVVQEKEVIKWKENENTKKNNDKIIIKVETILPDGTKKIETKIVDRGTITIDKSGEGDSQTDTNITKETESKKVTEYSKNDWSLNLLYAPVAPEGSMFGLSTTFGLAVSKRLIGPIYFGGFGLTNKTLGASLGISF